MAPPRVLILDLSVDPVLYRPVHHWRGLLGQVPLAALRPADFPTAEALLADAGDFTHLIVSGSEASVVEPAPWFARAEALLIRAVDQGKPVLGSCFGHQLIARALLGPRHVRRAATPELGWFPVAYDGGWPQADVPPRDLWMFSSHFDEVCDLPPDWRTLARTDHCAVHAFALADRPVWGLQAHPEIDPEEGAALLLGFAERRPEILPRVREALAGSRRDDGFGRELVSAFLGARP